MAPGVQTHLLANLAIASKSRPPMCRFLSWREQRFRRVGASANSAGNNECLWWGCHHTEAIGSMASTECGDLGEVAFPPFIQHVQNTQDNTFFHASPESCVVLERT